MYHFCSYNIYMLTKQQNKLFNFLKNRIKKTNVSPSFEEMKIAMGLKSKSGIQRLIDGLVERGFIEKKNNKKRAINILNNSIKKEEKDLINLPLLGTIAAGNPIEAIENTEDKIQIPLNLISPNKKNYVLKIEGDSMINKGIVDGDKAIIEYCNDANNGDIVVALINENEVTLKKLKKDKEKIYLIPENDNYKIQSFNPDEVSIQGKLKGIIRSY
ncbi:MAG: repressor LexA [Pelagibacteraceae bacterium]|nr:repressor LexA [Pelagibacteraceae bacterium]